MNVFNDLMNQPSPEANLDGLNTRVLARKSLGWLLHRFCGTLASKKTKPSAIVGWVKIASRSTVYGNLHSFDPFRRSRY
jgi:hypothetical protein